MELHVSDFRTGDHFDDDAIQACFAERKKYQEATIIFDGPDYWISQAICLSSNTTVIVDGCAIRQSPEIYDNIFRGDNLEINPQDPWGRPLSCTPLENVRILGRNGAKLIGPSRHRIGYHYVNEEYQEVAGDFWGYRCQTISLTHCRNFEVGGFFISKTQNWAIKFDLCTDGYIHDIEFDTLVKNGDGIDFRSGCHRCLVENITGTTSDDTIACSALFRPAPYKFKSESRYLYTNEPGSCIQERSRDEMDISDITIRNVCTSGRHHGIICLAANGCRVYNIHIENISEKMDPDFPELRREATVKIYTGYGTGYTPGDLHDITVENVHGVYAKNTLFCNAQVENITLKNITHEENEPLRLDYPEGITVL